MQVTSQGYLPSAPVTEHDLAPFGFSVGCQDSALKGGKPNRSYLGTTKGIKTMNEIRCDNCHRKLAMVSGFCKIEIKCPRCGTLNHQRAKSSDVLPTVSEKTCGLSHHSLDRR